MTLRSDIQTLQRKVRLVLYLPPSALASLQKEARERSERAGVEVTPEATARAMLLAALAGPVGGGEEVGGG